MTRLTDHEVFKALSEPNRLRIAVLLTEGELCVCDLTEVLSLPQSTVSRHVARLKASGLVGDRRDGKWVYYRLAKGNNVLCDSLNQYFTTARKGRPFSSDLKKLRDYRKHRACT